MKVRVRLFAVAREVAGANEVEVELPSGGTAGELRAALVERWPALAAVLKLSRIAVNADFAGDDRVLSESDEIALIPPVSGG
jgi:molybdopterin converting factor subunit 1